MEKRKNLIAGAAVIGIVVISIVVYLVTGGEGKEAKEVSEAVKSLAASMATGNKESAGVLISKKLKDADMDYGAVTEEFGIKHAGLMIEGITARVSEMQAEVSYTRKEIVDKKQVSGKITGEVWQKEDDGKWRLLRLSPTDRVKLPRQRKERLEKEEKVKADLAAAEAAEAAARNIPYTPAGKRDPFLPLIVEGVGEEGGAETATVRCDQDRPREFLEGFDLLSLKIVGIVYSNGYYALMEGQNGNGYTVKTGMYLGRRCGKVIRIAADRLVVAEQYPTVKGGFIVREMEIPLKEEVK